MRARNVYVVMILFLVQSFAASLVTIPTNFDLEEGSSDIQNTNARNNSSCGQDPALTNLIAYTDSTIYHYQGQAVSTTYLADCTVNGKDYELHAYVSGQSSNSWSDYDVWNWTETDSSELIYDGWANLPVDTYCWNASLYVISGTSLQYVDVEYGCFDVVASNNSGGGNNSGNNSGGGNNSGNNTGGGNNTNNTCGNDPNLTDLMVYIDPSAYVNSGDPVYAYYDINCTVIYNNYTLEVSLSNNSGYYSTNSWNWYETNNYEYISETWFNLNPGQYCVNATLWDVSNGAMNYVDVEYPCFTITASNNGGGNNGGGGNNSGNNSGGGNNTNNTCGNDPNLTDLMVYIDPSAYVNSGDPVYAYYDINCTHMDIDIKLYNFQSRTVLCQTLWDVQ